MKSSWKTTMFGLFAAIGAGVVSAYVVTPDLLADLPKWVKGVFALLGVIGTAGVGFSARDNNVTSEQAGAGKTDPNSNWKGILLSVGLCAGVVMSGLALTGCQGTPSRVAYNAAITGEVGVETALLQFKQMVRDGKVKRADFLAAKKALAAYQAADLALLDAADSLRGSADKTPLASLVAVVAASYDELWQVLVLYVPNLSRDTPLK